MPNIQGISSVQMWFPNQVRISPPSDNFLSNLFLKRDSGTSLALPAATGVFRELEMSNDLCHAILPQTAEKAKVFSSHILPLLLSPLRHTQCLLYLWFCFILKCYSLIHDWLFVTPMNCSLPGFSVHGILQARNLEWVAIPFSRESSWPKGWTWLSCITGRFFTIWATREAWFILTILLTS